MLGLITTNSIVAIRRRGSGLRARWSTFIIAVVPTALRIWWFATKEDETFEVSANHAVMACYNMMIPHIVTDLPSHQAHALRQQMKSR